MYDGRKVMATNSHASFGVLKQQLECSQTVVDFLFIDQYSFAYYTLFLVFPVYELLPSFAKIHTRIIIEL
jgi:hypothetical protein